MAEERVIKIVVDKKDAEKNVKDVNKNIKEVDKSTGELTGTLDKMSGGAVSGFKSLKGGLKSVINGFKSLRVAIIATGIGALIVGILAVKQAFTSSEEGQNKFAKLMGVIGSITGNLSDLLSDLGEKIIWVFENPKQALSDFGKLIKDNLFNRFNGILELIPNLGKAIKQLFKGDFSGASKTAINAVSKVALGTDNLTESIKDASKALKEFGKEIEEDAKKAAKIADQRAKADKIERNLIIERAKANREIADLRLKSEQRDKFTTLERIKFLKDANKLEDEVTKKEIYSARLRYNAKVQENALSKSTKEDLNEEFQLKAKLINLETTKLNLNKRLETRIQALSNEEKAKAKADADRVQKQLDEEEKARIEKANIEAKNELERLQKIADIQDEFKKKRENEENQSVLEKLELEKERKLLELDELRATEEQKAEIRKYYSKKIEEETTRIKKEEDAKKIKLEEDVEDAKINIAKIGLGILGQLAKKGSAIAKGVAVAQATINTYQGVTSALAAKTVIPDPIGTKLKFANAAAIGVAGLLNVRKILATNESGAGGLSAGGSSDAPSAPSFNLVQGTGSNQIAQTIGKDNKPVQAYVVGSNVTTQQEADRRRVENSSL